MKQLLITISDLDFQKFQLEAVEERKPLADIIKRRLMYKSFSLDVQAAYEKWLEENIQKIMREQ